MFQRKCANWDRTEIPLPPPSFLALPHLPGEGLPRPLLHQETGYQPGPVPSPPLPPRATRVAQRGCAGHQLRTRATIRPTDIPPATSCSERLRTGPRRRRQWQQQRTGRGTAATASPQPTNIMAAREVPTADLLGMEEDEEIARLQPPLLPLPLGPQPLAGKPTPPPSPTPSLYQDAEDGQHDEACGPAPAPEVPAAAHSGTECGKNGQNSAIGIFRCKR